MNSDSSCKLLLQIGLDATEHSRCQAAARHYAKPPPDPARARRVAHDPDEFFNFQHARPQLACAADAQAQAAPATILVSHGIALVSAGLVATLGRLPQCTLRVWDHSRGPWHAAQSLGDVDLVVTDAESFVPAARSANDGPKRRRRGAP